MAVRRGLSLASIATFVGIAFGISWTVWTLMYVFDLPWWVSIGGSWGPGLAALLIRGPLRREGFADSGLLRLGSGQAAVAAYVIALTLITFAAVSSTMLGIGAGAFQLDWNLYRGLTSPNVIIVFVSDHFGFWGLALSLLVIPLLPIIDLGEEIGWRDYLVPRLLPLGNVTALLVSGTVWAAWHIPFSILLGYNKGAAGYPLFALDVVLFGSLLGYLRLKSRSVWPCAILHTAYNYQPWVLIAFTLVRPGFSPASPQQSMAIVQYGVTMLAGLAALFLAIRARNQMPVQSASR
jgi:membrane protease YdiL (CAAX protease family)